MIDRNEAEAQRITTAVTSAVGEIWMHAFQQACEQGKIEELVRAMAERRGWVHDSDDPLALMRRVGALSKACLSALASGVIAGIRAAGDLPDEGGFWQ
jgi:hypothetical protein